MPELSPSAVVSPSYADRPQITTTAAAPRMRVVMLGGCAQQVLRPSINEATMRLLTRLGCEVVVAENAGCCGALVHHMGLEHEGHEAAKRNIAAWEAAEAKHLEYSEKLAKATEEIAGITDSIRREGELERDKIIAAAKELAVNVEQEAENKAAGVVAKARTELREEAASLAVELAEDMLKKQVSAEDQNRLVDEYMQKVGEIH